MAQTGFTPILIYSSSTAAAEPLAGSLTNSTLGSELAINITDGKLFYKDNANAIQVIGWKTVPTTAGGTGLTSYTAGDITYYASGTAFTKLAIGASGRWLGSSGTAPQWNAPAALTETDDTNVTLTLGGNPSTALLNSVSLTLGWTGQLAVTRGGTGLATVAQGDILYGSAANTLTALAKNTTATRYLSNTGTSNNPAWAQIDLTNGVTGALPTANGGTNLTSFTSSGVMYASSTSALATSANLTFDGTGTLRLGGTISINRLYGSSGNPLFGLVNSVIPIITTTDTINNRVGIAFGPAQRIGSGIFCNNIATAGGDESTNLEFYVTKEGNANATLAGQIQQDGYLMMGYTASNGAYRLQVNSQIFATNATIATSDGRYKENVTTLTNALDDVCLLRPVQFNWKKHSVHEFDTETPTIGFIAQELQQVLAEKPYLNSIVKKNECTIEPAEFETIVLEPAIEEIKDDEGNILTESRPAKVKHNLIKEAVVEEFYGIADGNLIPLLTAAIQELAARVKELENK